MTIKITELHSDKVLERFKEFGIVNCARASANWRKEGLVYFKHEGNNIFNPFYDESGENQVDPIAHYGIDNWMLWTTMATLKITMEQM